MDSSTCNCVGTAPSWAGKNVLAVITGATRGFGVSLAEEIIRVMCVKESTCPKSITLFLIGRKREMLMQTKARVESIPINGLTKLDVVVDFSFLLDFAIATEEQLEKCIKFISDYADNYESNNELHLLFNNAGTVGEVGKSAYDLTDISSLNSYTRVNLTSMISFTSLFLNSIKPVVHDSLTEHRSVCVINVSSLCAVLPFKQMSEYCSIKAARAMYLRCLASDRDDVSFFNYAPGPLKTDMFEFIKSELNDAEARKRYRELESQDRVLDPNMSARECVSWLGFLNTPSSAKIGHLCQEHHKDVIGVFTGNQMDYYDSKELPNPYRLSLSCAG